MKKTLISTLLLSFAASVAVAGVLDKAWLKGTTDKDPLSYAPGEEIVITVTPMDIDGAIPEGCTLQWKFSDDFGRKDEGVQPFTAEPFVYRTSLDRPGFVRLEAYVNGPDGKRYVKQFTGDATTPEGKRAMNDFEKNNNNRIFFDGGAAVRPDDLEPPAEPADFDEFWVKQFARLDLVPMKADRVEMESRNPNARVYAVRIDCAGLRPVTGYLMVPKAVDEGQTFPARLETHGYSGSRCTHDKPGWASDKQIVLNINAHGLKLPEFGATEADTKALRWEIRSHDKDYAFDPEQNKDPETAYFNGMVLRVKRALQYLKTVEGWNGKDLIASGGSQGGLQTLWAAGCGEGVTRAESRVPWCCDMKFNSENRHGWYIPWVDALGYYDAVNFAKRIPAECHVNITRAGIGDYVCPPTGIAKLWNVLHAGNKEIHWVQGSQHGFVPPKYEGRDTDRAED